MSPLVPTCILADEQRGYARWFGVDALCAVKELGMLGVTVDPSHVAMLECTHREKSRARAEARARRQAAAAGFEDDVSEDFAFLAET